MDGFSAGWELARRRMAADPFAVVATALVILLATILLSAGPLYTNAVTEAGLQRRLATAPPSDVGIEVVIRSEAASLETLDTQIRAFVDEYLGEASAGIDRLAESDSYRGGPLSDATITSVLVAADVADLVETVAEAAVDASAGTPVALNEDAAFDMGVEVGDRLTLVERRGAPATFVVASLFRPRDPSDRRWWDSPLVRDGVQPGVGFNEVGPLIVADDASFRAVVADQLITSRWRIRLRPEAVSAVSLGRVQQGVLRIGEDAAELDDVVAIEVLTELPALLATTSQELTATRASVSVTAIQLALLALYTLALVANLVVDTRGVETTLVRARGATPQQIGVAAALEGLVLAVPAVMLGPPVAAAVLRILDNVGVLADVGLVLDPTLTRGSFVASAAAGLAAVAVLVLPALRAASATFAGARASRSRTADQSFMQRSGIDLVLLVVAVAGLWQLRVAGSSVAEDASGVLGVDPLLVVAPALGLLAGAVFVLRVVPVLGRAAIRLTSRSVGFVGALSAWQVGRRPARTARSLLLLVLAVAIGTFASAYSVTWSQSQADQSLAVVAADLQVTPDARVFASQPSLLLGRGYGGIPGVEVAAAGLLGRVSVGSGGTAALVAVDLADPSVLQRRDDVAPDLDVLSAVASVAGVDLPGEDPDALTFDLIATRQQDDAPFGVLLTLQDADGLIHQLIADDLVTNGVVQPVVVPLAREIDGIDLSARAPLRLLGIEFLTVPVAVPPGPPTPVAPPPGPMAIDIRVASMAVDGVPVSLDAARDWTGTIARQVTGLVSPIISAARVTADGIRVSGAVGASVSRGRTGLRVAPPEPGDLADIPAIVTPGVMAATGLDVGGRFVVEVAGTDVSVTIAQVSDVIPTDPRADRAILVDLPTLAVQRYVRSRAITVPDRWFLSVARGEESSARQAVLGSPFRAPVVTSLVAETSSRRADPVAVGLIGALTAGLLGAGILAALGYLVTATVSVRQRVGEYALLRALGVTRGETRRWLFIESIVTVGGGMVLGLGLGAALAYVILPAVSLAADGLSAVPTPRLVIPWNGIGLVLIVSGVVLLVVPVVLATALERTRVAEVLRLGEET